MGTSASAGPGPLPGRASSLRLLPDRSLARLAARGESRAFEAIFRRYHKELYRYCRALLGDLHDAQDALQNTMTAALRALPGESREIALRPWLYRVAHNEAITLARTRARLPVAEDRHTDTAPGADVDAAERERLWELVADLSGLPDRQRGAIVMRELSGLSHREIAVALSISEGVARQTLYEAREAMSEFEKGRELDCVVVREAISARDGRVLRGRALRAHLRACGECRHFREAIGRRGADLQALAPPLSPLLASGLLGSIVGKGGSSATVGAAGAGGGIATGGGALALTKGNALVAALVIGAGTVGVGEAIDRSTGGGERQPGEPAAAGRSAVDKPSMGDARSGLGPTPEQPGNDARAADGRRQAGGTGDRGDSGRDGRAPAVGPPTQSNGQGDPAGGSDGVTGPPPQANGNGSGPPPQAGTGTGNAGGSSATAPGITGDSSRSQTGAENANAGVGGPQAHANNGGPSGN